MRLTISPQVRYIYIVCIIDFQLIKTLDAYKVRVMYQNITHIYTLSVYADVISVCHQYKPLNTARLNGRYHDITIIL